MSLYGEGPPPLELKPALGDTAVYADETVRESIYGLTGSDAPILANGDSLAAQPKEKKASNSSLPPLEDASEYVGREPTGYEVSANAIVYARITSLLDTLLTKLEDDAESGESKPKTSRLPSSTGTVGRTSNFASEAAFRAGQQCIQSGDMDDAVKLFQEAAERGHAGAMVSLGNCLSEGLAIEKDEIAAAQWFERAAEMGHADALTCLGTCFAKGRGVEKNKERAAELYGAAAARGSIKAMFNLGWCYEHGMGVSKDDQKSRAMYKQAAENGDAKAQFMLGRCYYEGKGVTRDLPTTVLYYTRAAKGGHPEAQFNLGCLYANGEGVVRDELRAVRYYKDAADSGLEKARDQIEAIRRYAVALHAIGLLNLEAPAEERVMPPPVPQRSLSLRKKKRDIINGESKKKVWRALDESEKSVTRTSSIRRFFTRARSQSARGNNSHLFTPASESDRKISFDKEPSSSPLATTRSSSGTTTPDKQRSLLSLRRPRKNKRDVNSTPPMTAESPPPSDTSDVVPCSPERKRLQALRLDGATTSSSNDRTVAAFEMSTVPRIGRGLVLGPSLESGAGERGAGERGSVVLGGPLPGSQPRKLSLTKKPMLQAVPLKTAEEGDAMTGLYDSLWSIKEDPRYQSQSLRHNSMPSRFKDNVTGSNGSGGSGSSTLEGDDDDESGYVRRSNSAPTVAVNLVAGDSDEEGREVRGKDETHEPLSEELFGKVEAMVKRMLADNPDDELPPRLQQLMDHIEQRRKNQAMGIAAPRAPRGGVVSSMFQQESTYEVVTDNMVDSARTELFDLLSREGGTTRVSVLPTE